MFGELPENIGRSKIRNRLADDAKYNTLLFLDCDSACENNQFLSLYSPYFGSESVCCGGRSYAKTSPDNKAQLLHWKYGKNREVLSAMQRQELPYAGFQTNNFLISKSVFQGIRLNEQLVGYGHEDTLFGIALKNSSTTIHHIDNPLVHIGLEEASIILEKSREGIKNLAYLIRNKLINSEIKLYKAYRFLEMLKLDSIVHKKLAKKEALYLDNLMSEKLKLSYFDRLKLLWLLEEMKG